MPNKDKCIEMLKHIYPEAYIISVQPADDEQGFIIHVRYDVYMDYFYVTENTVSHAYESLEDANKRK